MSLCESNTYSNQQTCNSHYLARSFTGMGGSVQFGKTSDLAAHSWNSSCANWGGYIGYPGYPYNGSNNSGGSYLGNPYPNPADMGLIMCPVFVHHNLTRRGFMRGLWAPGHYQPMNHLDTYSGTGSMAGKSFIAINCPIISSWQNANNSSYGTSQVHVEFSDTWD
jgi:hypothetical protein